MPRKRKTIIENVEVTDFAAEGMCIIKNDDQVIFVPAANIYPGDKVNLVVKKKRKSFAKGHILKIVEKSEKRVEAFCEHFGVCGGCKWQHVSYNVQLEQKQKQVKDQLERLGKVNTAHMQTIIPSSKTVAYRNKLEYTFSAQRWLTTEQIASGEEINDPALGFHVPGRYDKVVQVNKCHLQPEPSNEIRNFLFQYAIDNNLSFYHHRKKIGFLRTLMIRTASTGELMVALQFAEENTSKIEKTLNDLFYQFPQISSLVYFINTKGNDSYFDLEPVIFKGAAFIYEQMEDLKFKIGPKSFYQTNSEQAYELYKIAQKYAQIKPTDVVYDLYTGTGTIANFVAKGASKVVGIEYIAEAIEDAKENSRINNITNTSFYAGDLKTVLTDELFTKEGKPDIIITDPPRAGMDPEVIEQIIKSGARKVVYVSCNAATQARDLQLLSTHYIVDHIQPVDMFPHTHHVENVVSLNLKRS